MNAPAQIHPFPFNLRAGLNQLRKVEAARNECWRVAENMHRRGEETGAIDDQAAACDESADRLRGIMIKAIEQATGLSVGELREVVQ